MQKLSKIVGSDKVAGYVFIAPFIIGLITFTVIPFFSSLYLAFTDYDVLTPARWIGLANFQRMFFEDKYFWQSFWVTFKFALIQVPIKLLVSLGVALILSRKTRAIPIYRAAFYIPSLMGGSVAVALTWKQLFSYNGAINKITSYFGMEPVKWLSNPDTALGVLISLGVWQFGSSMLIFLAALKNVPQSYHEAAIVDGAGPVRRFFSIVLPMITPIFFFNLVNQTIGAFQAFNSSYLITQGKPLNTTLYYGVHLYNRAFTYYEMGYGSAMAWFMLLVIAAFTALIFRSSSAWVYYESEGR
ncbi:MAG TPA: sugar ABC transporter permease [Candidatus Ornithocaccomicrobium faecavium]|uniref:Sugar ABC transporter permease n=1 Tax=Candidatus Ornithocaccomicrobium faecavium TaxID=2840890 RepID=A0A9D1P5H6_9FIRM|nr:sugar ABC transporter permease [Candidatus Ornithocaccomicrobium faecavium]